MNRPRGRVRGAAAGCRRCRCEIEAAAALVCKLPTCFRGMAGLQCESGAEAASARIGAAQLAAPTARKRDEREPWCADELAVRRALLARLSPAQTQAALLDSTLMLQVIRGAHHHEQRLETIASGYLKVLDWRAGIGADTVLSDPPAPTVTQHAEWRQRWHLDVYGEDRAGRPILGHQLGRIDPSTFLDCFNLEMILLQYCRDLEFVSWRKRRLTEELGVTVNFPTRISHSMPMTRR